MLKQAFLQTFAALVVIFIALIFVLPTPSPISDEEAVSTDAVIIVNTRVFDGVTVLEDTSLLVEGGVITAIGSALDTPVGARRVDGTGQTVLPGLIDAHTHTYGTALKDSLRFGVTTNLDMFMGADLMVEAQERRESLELTDKADLYSAGTLATVKGGHGTQFGLPIETLSRPEDATDWVVRRKAEGSDYIKLVYIPGQTLIPSLDLPTARAIIEAAHENGLIALAHISTQAAAMDMVDAGIDGLVHIFADKPVSDDFITRAQAADIFIIPTLAVLAGINTTGENAALADDARLAPYLGTGQAESLARRFGADIVGFDLAIALANTGKLQAAGVAILAGSDAPNPGTTHGASLHHELDLLVRAGLSTSDALAAATGLPARTFSLASRGVLKTGARADFILVTGNPIDDITTTRDIVAVYKNGFEVPRSITNGQPVAASIRAGLGTFDDALEAPDGFIWTSTDDGMAGGSSTAIIAANGAGQLTVQATVTNDFAYPWAGAFLTVQDRNAAPASLSDFTHLTFQIKGTPGTYRAMMFDTGVAGVPPTQNFTISEDWQDVSLALKDFAGFSMDTFVGLALVAGPSIGEFQYQIDNVILK